MTLVVSTLIMSLKLVSLTGFAKYDTDYPKYNTGFA